MSSKLSPEQQAAGRGAELSDTQREAARGWLRKMAPEYEEEGGEVNRTKLGEDCANELGLFCDDFDATIPEEVWELADKVAGRYEKELTDDHDQEDDDDDQA